MEVVRERHERLHRGVEAADRPARGSRDAGGLRIRHRLEERAHAEGTGRTLFQAMADPGGRSYGCLVPAIRGFHATMELLMALSHDLHVDELLERVLEVGHARGARPRGGRARAP